jgi:outer membrane protein OmpA-like peptidoglycan-associated protein
MSGQLANREPLSDVNGPRNDARTVVGGGAPGRLASGIDPTAVLALQRVAGNRAVAALVTSPAATVAERPSPVLGRRRAGERRAVLRGLLPGYLRPLSRSPGDVLSQDTAAGDVIGGDGTQGVGAFGGYEPGEKEESRTSPGGVEETKDGTLLFNFAVNSNAIKPEHEVRLRKFVREARLDSKESLFPIKEVVGFGDAVNRQGGNTELREDRALTIQGFLSMIGTIDANIGTARPAAPDRFIDTNETRAGRSHNRAVLITTDAFLPPDPVIGPVRFRLQVKVIAPPRIPVATQLANVRRAYAPHFISVDVTPSVVVAPEDGARFNVVSVGHCDVSEDVAPDLKSLHETLRGSADDTLIVMFVVHDILRDTQGSDFVKDNGCAHHPADKPGGVVAFDAGPWTLAHEIGHVLGIIHHAQTDPDRLMHIPTKPSTDTPPTLAPDEVQLIRTSRLLHFRR